MVICSSLTLCIADIAGDFISELYFYGYFFVIQTFFPNQFVLQRDIVLEAFTIHFVDSSLRSGTQEVPVIALTNLYFSITYVYFKTDLRCSEDILSFSCYWVRVYNSFIRTETWHRWVTFPCLIIFITYCKLQFSTF